MSRSSEIVFGDVVATDGSIHLLELIHEGTMFCLYKARMNSKFVTLKTPRHGSAMLSEMLRREYDMSHTLSHPCIVNTLAFREDTPCGAAIIREYIDGVTLDDHLTMDLSMSQRDALQRNILDAVAYLHYRGVRHNDLKPENIIVSRSGVARIIDFGLSSSDDSVYSGCIGGTEGYTAPEIMSTGSVAGNASDIFSVGALLLFIYEGRRYTSVCRRSMSIDPQSRYQSIDELRKAMRRESVVRYALVATVLVVALGVLLVIMLHDGNTSTSPSSEPYAADYSASVAIMSGIADDAEVVIREQEYMEFAFAWRNVYLQLMVDHMDTLSGDELMAVQQCFCRHIPRLDSLCWSLPSISELPSHESRAIIERLDTMTFTPAL